MKLSRFVTGVLTVALVALLATDTFAQQDGRRGGDRGDRGGRGGFRGGPGGGGGFGGFRGGPGGGDITFALLRVEEVRTELELQPDQVEALGKIAESGRPDFGGERPDFRNMSDDERREFFEKMQKQREEQAAKMKQQLEEVLFPEQLERLEQISIQVRGLGALNDEEVAAKLKITDDQKEKLAQIREDLQGKMRDRMRELFSSGDRDAIRTEMEKARKEMEEQILGVLTSEQRAKFEEMKGKPFDMPESFRGGFGGRGGPGGPGGGGRGGFGGPGRGGPGGGGGRRGGRPPVEE